MPDVEVVTLIHTRLLRRGKGEEDDPVRVVDQWWTFDGELVAERDQWAESQLVTSWATEKARRIKGEL